MQAEAGITGSDVSLLNFVVSDGRSLIATRYVSSTAEAPASLYYAEGSAYEREQLTGEVSLKYSAAAKALHGEEGMMEGAAGARSRQVTGAGGRRGRVEGGRGSGSATRSLGCIQAKGAGAVGLQAIRVACALHCLLHPCFAHCCRGGRLPFAVLGPGQPRVPHRLGASHLGSHRLGEWGASACAGDSCCQQCGMKAVLQTGVWR